jgi:hypothetical protein
VGVKLLAGANLVGQTQRPANCFKPAANDLRGSPAKAGDATARAWLSQYLVGKPVATAPAPLTVIVQQLSGRDPLVDRLAKPHIDRAEYPALGANDDFEDAMRELIARELRALEVQKSNPPETGADADGTRPSADWSAS